ncbi:chemotaxis protein CheD [Vibrio sp. S4M6]|uniref:chemotaxis protein CheD n=1 Tax=Vibrio sinus TaxID=2946865 RepID=UPI00202A48AC|nr:chemotaxis protein CheD [Vibrio sinus]MCL9781667.1 chemotaxis protein CheD [Vibrio sinus]
MTAMATTKYKHDETYINRFYHPQKQKHLVKVMPGGVYWSEDAEEIICTGLGSCVAACIWDEEQKIGGLNHFLLPFDSNNQLRHWHPDEVVSTASRYGSFAMEMLINSLVSHGARRENLKVKLFGGAKMMGHISMIGKKNIEFVRCYVDQESLRVVSEDLGGDSPRKVMFEPTTGRAWIKKLPFNEVHIIHQEEEKYASQLDKESHRNHDDDVELF